VLGRNNEVHREFVKGVKVGSTNEMKERRTASPGPFRMARKEEFS
jgi:hypothetical protein